MTSKANWRRRAPVRTAVVTALLIGAGATIVAATTPGDDESADDADAPARSSPSGPSPAWINDLNGGPLTAEQEARIVEYGNGMWGTDFTTIDEVAAHLREPTTTVRELVAGALVGVEPIVSLVVNLPGGIRSVTVSDDQVRVLRDRYGLSNDQITDVIRLTAVTAERFVDPATEPAWQPMVALLVATEQSEYLQDETDASRERRRIREIVALMPPGWPVTEVMRQESEEPNGDTADRARWRRHAELLPVGWPARDAMLSAAGTPTRTETAIARLYTLWDEGLATYNHDPSVAYLHALDPALAARIAASGGDTTKLSGADNTRAWALLREGGLVTGGSTPFEQIGGIANGSVLTILAAYFESVPNVS